MKNYRDSDYAANKYANGIVYRFANQTVEITLEDYLRENPGKSEANFTELKVLSDEMYLEQVRGDTAQGKPPLPDSLTISGHGRNCMTSAESKSRR